MSSPENEAAPALGGDRGENEVDSDCIPPPVHQSIDTPQNSSGEAGQYLADRGVSIDTVRKHGIEIDSKPTSERFRNRLGFDAFKEGKLADLAKEVIWFPCRDVTGKPVSWIDRPLPAIGDAKFLNPKGDAYPFIPLETWEAKDKPHKPLILTEGPVKAFALVQAGHLAIGVGGVWMATSKEPNGSVTLAPALSEFVWSGRTVYLAFDADAATNPSVKQALLRTFLELYKLGAKVRFLTWPLSEGKGIDDYLHAKHLAGGKPADTLTKLLDAAQEVNSILVPEDLTMIQRELVVANLNCSQVSQISRILSDSLNVRASSLEKDVIDSAPDTTNKAFELVDPEPWPDHVDGGELLGEIVELLRRHVVMSEEQALAAALWVTLTYVEDHVDTLPILAITSPQKRCGKSTLLSILRRLVRKPLAASSVSAAALFRSIEKWTPTLLIDEADTFLKENDELRGVINSGHTRDLAYVLRVNTETLDPEGYSTWGPKAIACIGRLPDTLTDRSVEIRLQRRTQAEPIAPIRDTAPETFERLRQQLKRWALDYGAKVRSARPQLPLALHDRAADNWLPLLAIAGVVGAGWPEVSTKAALGLYNAQDPEETVQIAVLVALQEIFEAGADFEPTDAILDALNKNKEAPWADWKNRMTAEKLAKTLRPFNVKPKQKRRGRDPLRGYLKEDLQPVFGRYLTPPSPPPPEKPVTPVTPPADQVLETIGASQAKEAQPVTSQVEPLTSQVQKPNPLRAEAAPRLDSRAGVTGSQVKMGVNGEGGLNGHPLVQSAVQIFKGEIVTPDELEPDLCCAPELPASPAPQSKPNPRPSHSALENRLVQILAPHDYDGGLSYGQFRRQAQLPDDVFDQTLKNLCRRGGPVYKSALNNRYQFSPRFAEILARQKASGNGSTQPSQGRNASE